MNKLRILVLAATLGVLALPAVASASKSQEAIFQDDFLLIGAGVGTQVQALGEMQGLGVDTIHTVVYWPKFVPGDPSSGSKPSGDSSDPSWYPPEKWDVLDSLVTQTATRGLSLIVAPAGSAAGGPSIRVPKWARSGNSPRIAEYAKFMTALGTRYSGRYKDENGGTLPSIRRWSIWNEPNQGGWIQPQWRNGVLFGAKIYRDLFKAGKKALKKTGHGGDKIYIGETAPVGAELRRRNATSATSPGIFMREVACVDASYRAYRGRDASRRGCNGFRKLSASGLAHHIYTEGKGQPATYTPRNKDEMPIGAVDRVFRLLSKIKRRISTGGRVYNTEFGFQSNPPDRTSGVSLDQQAENENVAEYLSYKAGKLLSFTHYLMIDDPATGPRQGGFQTGLKFLGSGGIKPAYAAYAMPLVVRKAGSKVKVFGGDRPSNGVGSATILADGAPVATVPITNPRGYFDVKLTASPGSKFQLVGPAGRRSRVAKVSKGVK